MPKDQAGFVRGRSCSEKVLSLTSHIENRFQNKLTSGTVFLDLSSAYDTVWKSGLLLKLARVLKCKTTIRLLDRILSDRHFKLYFNGEIGKKKCDTK
jgi:hypothetical protein